MSVDTLPALVRQAAAVHAGRPAIVDGEQRIDFTSLAAGVMQAARGFIALGIARGDRVAIWAPNGWAWQIAALGAQSVGAVLVPLNTRWKGREAADVLARSRARALVTVVDFLGVDYVARLHEHLRESATALPELRDIIIVDGAPSVAAHADALDWRAFLDGGNAVATADAEARARGVMADDISDLIFTAGTTGQSKGVACTHGQTLRVFRTWSEIVGLHPRDRYLVVNPYFHTFGYKAGWLACLLTGATCLPHPVFDVPAVLARVSAERITVLPGPPTLYQMILDHPERGRFDLSSLRLAVTGAATIPVELIRRMRAELNFDTILTAYGLTESCGVVTMCRPGDDLETIARTSGRAIPGVELRIVDGEVRVRGYNVMRGYWDDPVATAAAVDSEGWLRTGDIGVLDERGNLRITDRLKDMLIVGGFNVYPAEVEGQLVRHKEVAQAAVVGVPDVRMGEVPYAFVVLRPHAHVASSDLLAWARNEMANYKVPRHVEIVDALPMNAAGKVLKFELRKRAAAAVSVAAAGI